MNVIPIRFKDDRTANEVQSFELAALLPPLAEGRRQFSQRPPRNARFGPDGEPVDEHTAQDQRRNERKRPPP